MSGLMRAEDDSPAKPDFSKMPIELLIKIASQMSICSLAAFASTCSGLHDLPKLCITSEEDFDKFVARDRREPWWRECPMAHPPWPATRGVASHVLLSHRRRPALSSISSSG
jgi:hypothetical protein